MKKFNRPKTLNEIKAQCNAHTPANRFLPTHSAARQRVKGFASAASRHP